MRRGNKVFGSGSLLFVSLGADNGREAKAKAKRLSVSGRQGKVSAHPTSTCNLHEAKPLYFRRLTLPFVLNVHRTARSS